MRASETEAGNKSAIGESGEEVLLLLLRAVASEEFPRTEAVRDGDGGIGIEALRGKLLKDRGNGMGGEAQTAPLLGDLHAEEFLGPHVIPGFL